MLHDTIVAEILGLFCRVQFFKVLLPSDDFDALHEIIQQKIFADDYR